MVNSSELLIDFYQYVLENEVANPRGSISLRRRLFVATETGSLGQLSSLSDQSPARPMFQFLQLVSNIMLAGDGTSGELSLSERELNQARSLLNPSEAFGSTHDPQRFYQTGMSKSATLTEDIYRSHAFPVEIAFHIAKSTGNPDAVATQVDKVISVRVSKISLRGRRRGLGSAKF